MKVGGGRGEYTTAVNLHGGGGRQDLDGQRADCGTGDLVGVVEVECIDEAWDGGVSEDL